MKKAKKLLSLFLAVLMLFSCVSVGIGGISVFAAAGGSVTVAGSSSVTYNRVDDVIICVPETIYMSPTTGASNSGQYFVNNIVDSSGKVTLATDHADTTGQISIYAPGATAFSLDVTAAVGDIGDPVIGGSSTDANSTYEGTTWNFSNFGNASDYATYDALYLYINGTGLSMGSAASIKWAVTLKYPTGDVTYYVYSTLYTPHLSVGAVSESRRSGTYNNEISVWISGGNGSPNGTWSPLTSGGGDKTTAGYFKYDPLWNGLQGGSSESSDDYVTASSLNEWKYVEAKATSGSDGSRAVGYLGYLNVDSSRYTNTTQIPNFKIGSDALRVNSSKKDSLGKYYAWYTLGDSSIKIDSGYSSTPSGWTQFVNKSEPQSTSRDTLVPSYDVSSINGKYIHVANQGYCTYLSSKNYANACASVLFTTVDKSELRKLVLQCSSLNNANYAYGWDCFIQAYENAAYVLGNPCASATDISTAISRLNTAINGGTDSALGTCPGLQVYVNYNANGGSVSSTGAAHKIGTATTVSVTPPTATRTGYTFKGWATSSSATSGASTVSVSLYNRNLYATWEANKYNVVFDNLVDFSKWNTTTASNATISNVTNGGFTLTSNEGAGEGTSTSPFFPVTPGKQYRVDIDIEGNAWDVYIFFCDANGTWVDFADGASNRYSYGGSTGVDPDNAVFTAPDKDSVVKAQIRVDANGSNNTVKFSNIRVYEVGTVEDGVSYETSKTVTYNNTVGSLPTPTRENYDFLGWYTADGTKVDSSTVMGASDIYVTSEWKQLGHSITWKVDGQDDVVTIVKEGETPVYPNGTPTKAPTAQYTYTFTGWSPSVTAATSAKTYTAQFSAAINKYKVTWVVDGKTVKTEDVAYGTVPSFGSTPTKEGSAEFTYQFAGWDTTPVAVTEDVTYTAVFNSITNTYAVTWYDENGTTVLDSQTVKYGETPVYAGETPTKAADNGYTYEFAGWNPTVSTVTGVATYVATYKATLIPYTITLDAGEGSVSTNNFDYNYESTSVTLPDATRTGYTFAGWTVKESVGSWTAGDAVNGTLSNAYGNVTLVANYTPKQYTVNYNLNGGTLADGYDSTFVVTYENKVGSMISDAELTRTGYTFKGWTTESGVAITSDYVWTYTDVTDVYAQWEATEYTITFNNRDMTSGSFGFVTPPSPITYTIEDDLSTILPDTAVEGYNFNYWGVMSAVGGAWQVGATYATEDLKTGNIGDVTLVMVYTLKSYTITWKNFDGSVLMTDSVYHGSTPEYNGETPVKAPDAEYSYTFSGWDPEVTVATSDATYTAQYTAKDREYTVMFVDWDGTEISTQSLKYGVTPAIPADPTRESTAEFNYAFVGWTPAVENVTADVTYTADYIGVKRSYTITWIVDDETTTTTVPYGETPKFDGTPTKDADAQYTYTFAGWSPVITSVTGEATYTAQFDTSVNSYSVVFKNEDGTVLDEQTLEYGETPVYAGETPTKAADVQFTYTFDKWTPEIDAVTGDITYTATYSTTVNKYTITFVDEDGTELQSSEVEYGTVPAYTGTTPTKAATVQYTYTFAGWNTTPVAVTGDATYTATYDSTVNKYTVTFYDEDGTTVLKSEEVEYGTVPAVPEDPTKAGNAQYSYTFAGWTPEVVAVEGEASYQATYTESVNKYTITFVNDDGTMIQSAEVEYGTVPAVPANPTKDATAQYTYTFNGWDKTVVAVTEATTYTATYISTVNKYNVTFKDDDGSVIDTFTLEYGATPVAPADPTKEATAEWTYTFAGWTPSIADVTGEATYTATYTATKNSYTITWIVDGNATSETVEYGKTPVFTGSTDKAADAQYTYTFAGWTPEVVSVTGNATYTATYNSTVNKYTIKFVNDDGSEIQKSEVAYGTVPAVPANPTKAATAQYTYTFNGWDKAVVAVTEATTYTATYTSTVNKYNVTFKDDDGSVIDTFTLEYGATPVAPADPTKEATAEWTYTFAGWTPSIADVTGEATYTATYTATKNSYTITWIVDGNATSETVEYGKTPVFTGSTDKAADAQYTYTFAGWTPEVVSVTGNATYTATYNTTVNKYTVSFYDEDGTYLYSNEFEYGSTPVYGGEIPTKESEGGLDYAFSGWTAVEGSDNVIALPTVVADASYYAVYVATNQEFTVTWYNEDGTVGGTKVVTYGTPAAELGLTAAADRASTAQYDFEFVGWNVSDNSETALDLNTYKITADTSFYPAYKKTVREYTVKFVDEDGTELQSGEVAYGETPVYAGSTPVKEGNAQYSYTFAGWDNEVVAVTGEATYTATYTQSVNKYTITFLNDDGSVLKSATLEYGTTPETPTATKAATAQYTYTFAGWDNEVVAVTGNATYKATYTSTVNKYVVKFVDENGTELQSGEIAYGETPVYAGETPVKEGNAQYSYAFAGWSPAISEVTGVATYTATYTESVNEYTIKFVNEDGTELKSDKIPYGTMPVEPAAPTKTGDAQYSYTFAGWDNEVVEVTADATYTATYTQSVNKYTITFLNDDGSVLKSVTLEYGANPEVPTATKAATAQYTYTFAGWDNEVVAVTGNATYKATYTSTVNKYVVKFVDENGTELQSGEIAYGETPVYEGETPVKEGNAQYSYTFAGWSPAISEVTGVATYTATYTESVNEYTIKFVDEDGTVLQSSEWKYGATPVYTGATPTKAATAQYTYTFKDWGTIATVTGEATYTATYDATVNKYTIKFVNEDGTVLQSSEWEYGATPVYTGATPTKAATAQYTYTFKDWGTIATVTGEATYTATYDATVNTYTITWVTGTGTFEGSWEYGSTPDYAIDNVDTSKSSTVSTVYTFSGWDNEIAEVTGDATYTAQYTETPRKYTITWVVDGTETSADVEYGTVPTVPAAPSKDATVQYEYVFTGWDKEVVAVTGEATYTAVFEATVRKYTITWITGAGTFEGTWEYGATPDPVADNVDTSKAATAEATYKFTGWDKTIYSVTGATTYTAQYDADIRSYTVTYVVEGEVIAVETVKFGTNFEHPAIPEKVGYGSYWDVTYMTMPAEDITVTAIYTAKKYTVTWIADGKTVATEDVTYGSAIALQTVPSKVGHDGEWDNVPETMPAENITITAVYTPAVYTVVWSFSAASGTDTATFGETWSVVFINYIPFDVRITVNGLLLSTDSYTYDAASGYLQINPDAITGNISITERAIAGYQNVVISAVNATVTNAVSIIKEGTTFHTQIVPNEGYLLPTSVVVCIDGVELHSGYKYDLTTGRLTVNGDVIYGELSIRFESPIDPEYVVSEDGTRCTCNCHSTNVFVKFFFSIATFFRKLFGMSQYRYCDCGAAHW